MLDSLKRVTCGLALLAFTYSLAAQQQSPLPPLPPDIPKNAVIRMFLTDKVPSGQDAVWTTPDGAIHEFFQFNDRDAAPRPTLRFGSMPTASLPPKKPPAWIT
jgi:hypothetical protein